ncbi:MAG TPA: hypothetical protein VFS40_07970 [Gemmatimonadales bacterium]|nr:hypothetical protein [Gemmatimonadales bacterium]
MLQADVAVPARNAAEAFRVSVGNALGMFVRAIPRVLGFAVVLIVGWFVASLIAKAVDKLLEMIHFDALAERSGFSGFVRNMGVRTDASSFVADLAKWFVRLITLVVAFDTLGLPAVSGVLQQLLLWLPNLVVALVVLVIGGLAARALSNLVRGSTAEAGFSNPDLLAGVARFAVLAFAVIVAVNQIGVAQTLMNALIIGAIGALSLATGLAFGLGGRDKAARVLDALGRQADAARPVLREAMATAGSPAGTPGAAGTTSPSSLRGSFIERSGYDRRRMVRDAMESGRGGTWVERSGHDRRGTPIP